MPYAAYDQITVDFEERWGPPSFTQDDKGYKTSRTYRVAYADHVTFMNQMLGRTIINPGPPVTLVVLRPVRLHDNPNAAARRCNVVPLGMGRPDPIDPRVYTYDECDVTVEFETEIYDDNDNSISIRVSSDSQILTIPDNSLEFASGDIHEGDAGILINQTKIEMTWRRAPYIPDYAFDLAGHVNSAPFNLRTPNSAVKPIGTILYTAAQAEETINANGEKQYSLSYSFTHRRIPHNHFFNKRTGLFEPATFLVSGDPPYPSGNLELLFS